MSDAKTVTLTAGPSALTLLGVLFVGLKLTNVVSWSWFFVTMPFWIGGALLVACILLFLVCVAIAHAE